MRYTALSGALGGLAMKEQFSNLAWGNRNVRSDNIKFVFAASIHPDLGFIQHDIVAKVLHLSKQLEHEPPRNP